MDSVGCVDVVGCVIITAVHGLTSEITNGLLDGEVTYNKEDRKSVV